MGKEPLLSRKMQSVYHVAEVKLCIISTHPQLVNDGCIGYFMTVENIKEILGSLNPIDWYKNQLHEGEIISFDDLPIEDQIKLNEVLNELMESSMSQNDLERKCIKCGHLAYEFGNKILARKST